MTTSRRSNAFSAQCDPEPENDSCPHDRVRTYIAEYFMFVEPLRDDMHLVDDLGADSLDLLQMVQEFNDLFDIEIDAEALPDMLTVGGAFATVQRMCIRKQR
jgi:acyl carrier protein